MKKKNKIFKPIYNHTYIHKKKKYIDMVISLELNMLKNRKKNIKSRRAKYFIISLGIINFKEILGEWNTNSKSSIF